MLNPRLNNCVACTTIANLLEDIDCKLTELAKRHYQNIVFGFGYIINDTLMFDLLHYKRILIYKVCNEDYAGYTVENIASKVKLLINK